MYSMEKYIITNRPISSIRSNRYCDVAPLDKLPKVGIVYSYSNVEPEALDALITNSYQGLVHAGVGNGNIHKNLFDKLVNASKQGILVVRSSRVPTGPTTLDAEVDDAKYGFVAFTGIESSKSPDALDAGFDKNKRPTSHSELF